MRSVIIKIYVLCYNKYIELSVESVFLFNITKDPPTDLLPVLMCVCVNPGEIQVDDIKRCRKMFSIQKYFWQFKKKNKKKLKNQN